MRWKLSAFALGNSWRTVITSISICGFGFWILGLMCFMTMNSIPSTKKIHHSDVCDTGIVGYFLCHQVFLSDLVEGSPKPLASSTTTPAPSSFTPILAHTTSPHGSGGVWLVMWVTLVLLYFIDFLIRNEGSRFSKFPDLRKNQRTGAVHPGTTPDLRLIRRIVGSQRATLSFSRTFRGPLSCP